MSPDHRGEWPSTFRHHEIGRHDPALRTVVSDVVNCRGRAALHANLFEVERRLLIVVEVANEIGILRKCVIKVDRKDANYKKQLQSTKGSHHNTSIWLKAIDNIIT